MFEVRGADLNSQQEVLQMRYNNKIGGERSLNTTKSVVGCGPPFSPPGRASSQAASMQLFR